MGKLQASAGTVDITPTPGIWLTGFAARKGPSTGVHDSLMARALLLDDGVAKLAIVSCDLLGFAPVAVAEMRRRIAEKSEIPAENVLICCTHTHSGPASMPMRGTLGYIDQSWLAEAQNKVVELVAGLSANLRPAEVSYASTTVRHIGHNRQDASHPIDEGLVAAAIDSTDGHPIATLLNYATHAVTLGPSNLLLSGDFPGATARCLDRTRGGVGLYLQGACGDVDPAVYRDRGWGTGTFQDCEEIGLRLAETADAALAGAAWTRDVSVRVLSKFVDVPLDPPPSQEEIDKYTTEYEELLASSQASTQELGTAKLSWLNELKSAISAGTVPRIIPAEVFAASINDLLLIGLPLETYSDIGVAIKKGLEPRTTMFAGYANGLFGYLPTRRAKDEGGYGPADSYRWFSLLTPVAYGADELLVRESVELGRKVWSGR